MFGGKKHIWWWVFSSEETKNKICKKITTVEQLPSTVNTSTTGSMFGLWSDKLSDRCSLKDWLGEFPSTQYHEVDVFQMKKWGLFPASPLIVFRGDRIHFKSLKKPKSLLPKKKSHTNPLTQNVIRPPCYRCSLLRVLLPECANVCDKAQKLRHWFHRVQIPPGLRKLKGEITIPHRIHGTGIFTYIYVDLYAKCR